MNAMKTSKKRGRRGEEEGQGGAKMGECRTPRGPRGGRRGLFIMLFWLGQSHLVRVPVRRRLAHDVQPHRAEGRQSCLPRPQFAFTAPRLSSIACSSSAVWTVLVSGRRWLKMRSSQDGEFQHVGRSALVSEQSPGQGRERLAAAPRRGVETPGHCRPSTTESCPSRPPHSPPSHSSSFAFY